MPKGKVGTDNNDKQTNTNALTNASLFSLSLLTQADNLKQQLTAVSNSRKEVKQKTNDLIEALKKEILTLRK